MIEGTLLPRWFGARDWLVVLGVAVIGLIGLFGGWWLAELRVREAVASYALKVAERVTEAAAGILDPDGTDNATSTGKDLRETVFRVLQQTSGVRRMIAYKADGTVGLDSTGAGV